MATLYAQATGDCDSIAWNTEAGGGGSSVPWASQSATDVLIANSYTVALSSAANGFTRGSIQTDASGGGFTVSLASAAYSFTADVTAGATKCLTTSGASYKLTVTGDVTGGTVSSALGIDPASLTTTKLEIIGNVLGGSASAAYGVGRMAYGGTQTITGNITGGSSVGLQVAGSGYVVVSGNITAGTAVAIIEYSTIAGVTCGGNLVCSSSGKFPIDGNLLSLKMTGTGSGAYFSVRDGDLNEVQLTAGGGGGGGSCRIIGG